MNISLIIRATDRASSLIGRVTTATKRLTAQGLRPLRREGETTDQTLARLGRTGSSAIMRIDRAARATARGGMRLLELGAYKAGVGIGSLVRKAAGGAFSLAKWGLLGGVASMGAFGAGVISIASDFEQFEVILENTEGSAQKASKAMAWVARFAKTTPYEVSQVMEAFVRLRAYGIDPTNGSMTSLGNAASGMGKDIMQAVEMIADAQTGEFERLKEFGIKASQNGNKVTYSWSKNGKDMSRTSTKSSADIRKAILGIFDANYAGMMDRQSRTFAGTWSNLKDGFASFQLDVAKGGVFDLLKGKLGEMLDWVNKKSESGEMARWAKRVSDEMSKLVVQAGKFVNDTDWPAAVRGVGAVAGAVVSVVTAIGQAASAWSKWQADVERRKAQGVLDSWFASDADKAAARQRLVEIDGQPPRPKKAAPWPKGKPMVMRPGAHSAPWPTSTVRPPLKVGGQIDIRLRTDPGVSARPTILKSNSRDVPINVFRGPVTAG